MSLVNEETEAAMRRAGIDKVLDKDDYKASDRETLVAVYATSLVLCTEEEVRSALAKAIV